MRFTFFFLNRDTVQNGSFLKSRHCFESENSASKIHGSNIFVQSKTDPENLCSVRRLFTSPEIAKNISNDFLSPETV